MSFFIGQKVVCISVCISEMEAFDTHPNNPRCGEIYTIRGLMWDGVANREGCLLAGVINPIRTWGDGSVCEASFWVGFFRPVTDISVFKKMLGPVG